MEIEYVAFGALTIAVLTHEYGGPLNIRKTG